MVSDLNNILSIMVVIQQCFLSRSHPERPDRITRIYEKHSDCGLLDRCKVMQVDLFTYSVDKHLKEVDHISDRLKFAVDSQVVLVIVGHFQEEFTNEINQRSIS